jgi:type IV pilus assembly protein PilM
VGNKFLKFFGVVSDPIIGIDIGSSAVKLLHLDKKGQQYCVERYAIEPLMPGVVVEKTIKDHNAVVTALKKVLTRADITEALACISVPNAEAITRVIQLNAELTAKDIATEIDLEADRYIPYSLDEVNLDFTVIGKSATSEDLMDVLLAVSKNENVDSRVKLLEQAKINTGIVDIDSFAMERAFTLIAKQLPEGGENMVVAVIDIGATITTLNIFHNKRSIYTRDQSFGGQHLMNEIQTRYGLSYEEAILARKYNNLPDDYLTEVLQPFKETVAKQVSRACQFFFSSGEHNQIHYLFLTGGTSNIPGLEELVFAEIGVKTAVANPFSNMIITKKVNESLLMEDAPALMNCCGLALRNCTNT